MARVFLHIGAPKTGTTYLQDVLWLNRAALRAHGVLVPGDRPGAHFHAAQDLRGYDFRGHPDPRVPGSWDRLAGQCRAWAGHTVLVSHELLAGCGIEEIRHAVDSLQPHEVHVVHTARDLGRQIPAMWQESVKNGRLVPYDRYLRQLRRPRPGMVARVFWHTQDAAEILRRWSTVVPAERVHVVTVPPGGAAPGELWRRFCAVTGIDPDGYDTSDAGAQNASLGLAEAELVRRLNSRLDGRLPWPAYEALLKKFLAERLLATRRDTARTRLPRAEHGWVRARCEQQVADLLAGGYDVVGSLDELVPRFGDDADATATPSEHSVSTAAVDALAVLLTEHVRHPSTGRRARLRRAARRLHGLWHSRAGRVQGRVQRRLRALR